MDKTSMVFSRNVSDDEKDEIRNLWGGSAMQQYEKYLGLPPMTGRKKFTTFSKIKSRVWKKLQCWKAKQLSQGGKEVLLKAVTIAIPTYAMSCFKLPDSLLKDLEGCRNLIHELHTVERDEGIPETVDSLISLETRCYNSSEGESSNSNNLNRLWKSIWKIKLPLKSRSLHGNCAKIAYLLKSD
ncbi:uncharacterized protein LOC122274570 [Carya illinoinensis]|uniref:uncharacterized protein LOC122274570 n=1 Tax=Carya illinoinensis TaxID=32201 RepID=UPI001C71F3CB|nr:uncharacterized protein LOC122274570 [Carya illinoinensis]